MTLFYRYQSNSEPRRRIEINLLSFEESIFEFSNPNFRANIPFFLGGRATAHGSDRESESSDTQCLEDCSRARVQCLSVGFRCDISRGSAHKAVSQCVAIRDML